MFRFIAAAAFAAVPLLAFAQDEPPPEANKLFLLKVAQAVDDRCRIMPPEIRREFDGRVDQLAATVAAKLGRAKVDEISRAAPERAKANGEACDERARRFVENGFVQSAPPPK